MYSKELTYKDFNGVERKETFYFNLTELEFTEFQAMLNKNGIHLDQIMKAPEANIADLLGMFKTLVLSSYGEKSSDGRYFNKLDIDGHKLSIPFSQSAAYYQLINDITESPEKATEFFKNVLPESLSKLMSKVTSNGVSNPESEVSTTPPITMAPLT